MNTAAVFNPSNIFGFYELDSQGTVLYSRAGKREVFQKEAPPSTGQNFFGNVISCDNANALRRRFHNFIGGKYSSENFIFNCESAENIIPLRIMLVRVSKGYGEHKSLFYMDIKTD